MHTATRPTKRLKGGPASGGLAAALREGIAAGKFPGGSFIPGERELAKTHSVARMTARRALKTLENEGLVCARPGKGYQVLARANDPDLGAPMAFVLSQENIIGGWEVLYARLSRCLERQAAARGWKIVQYIARRDQMATTLEQIHGTQACGLIVDSAYPEVLSAAAATGLPAVVIDAFSSEAGVDSVVQDDFLGGESAAGYLAARGHKRIAWLGPRFNTYHSRARFGGVVTGLAAHDLGPSSTVHSSLAGDDARAEALKLLSGPDRPTAVIALWRPLFIAIRDAARQLGLKLGRDLELVGWCVAEAYEGDFKALFHEDYAPAAVTWSAAEMVELAVERLAARRSNPGMAFSRLTVATTLVPASGKFSHRS
jgi:DNA-binding LacI/PurR family transcriptional regulator